MSHEYYFEMHELRLPFCGLPTTKTNVIDHVAVCKKELVNVAFNLSNPLDEDNM